MSQKKYDDGRYILRGKFYVLYLDSGITFDGLNELNDGKINHNAWYYNKTIYP